MKEGLWFIQKFTEGVIFQYKINKIYFTGETSFQKIDILDIAVLGKSLFLDKKIQSAEIDEFVYHEALVHPAMMAHSNPERVLIIGGGEGAVLREVLKHNSVHQVTMVDIDKELVELCAKYMPEWSKGAFEHPKTKLIFNDARKFIEQANEKFDVVISDLTEPIEKGPSLYLFTREFYQHVFDVLDEEGILIVQSGSTDPFYNHFFSSIFKTLESVFPTVKPYWTFVFSFNIPWGFNLAFKKGEQMDTSDKEISQRINEKQLGKLRFFHSDLNKGLFSLPLYLCEALTKGRILTDSQPFIWEV
ncbi:MAG: polyamine aminopropyltransferase [Candidatus Aminicenantia bacterium]